MLLVPLVLAAHVFPGQFDVRSFGARGDGKTDDTRAFQQALSTCGKSGGVVYVPPGRYLLGGVLSVPTSVTLQGTFQAPPKTKFTSGFLEKEKGSILLTTQGAGQATGTPFITLHRESTLKGLVVFYPGQRPSIVPYPWCVRGNGDNVSIINCLLVNPYQAVDLGTASAGRHYVRGLYAQPLKTGLYIDHCFDVGRVEDVHFWPFWTSDPKVWDWTKQHGTAFLIGRTDWEYMSRCFDIFYHVGYRFFASTDGPGNAVLTECGSDIGPCSVEVDSVQGHAGVSFVNSQFMCGVKVGPHNSGPVKFTACGFWGVGGVTDTIAQLDGSGQTTFTACHFTGWHTIHADASAIVATGGALTVNGCEFLDAQPGVDHIRLGPGVKAAIVAASTFRARISIENQSRGQVSLTGNVSWAPPKSAGQ